MSKPISNTVASPDPSRVKSDLQHLPAKKQIPKHIDEGDAQWIALAPNLYKVCGVPFIEPTDRFVQKYLKESTAALKAVSDEKLLPLAQKCLGYLN